MEKFVFNKPNFKLRRRSLRKNQTDAERKLWKKLRNKQLLGFKFFRQYSVGPFILDFYCPFAKLEIELDGSQHVEAVLYDQRRTDYLKKFNIVVLRFWDNDVLKNIGGVLMQIAKHITPPNLPLN